MDILLARRLDDGSAVAVPLSTEFQCQYCPRKCQTKAAKIAHEKTHRRVPPPAAAPAAQPFWVAPVAPARTAAAPDAAATTALAAAPAAAAPLIDDIRLDRRRIGAADSSSGKKRDGRTSNRGTYKRRRRTSEDWQRLAKKARQLVDEATPQKMIAVRLGVTQGQVSKLLKVKPEAVSIGYEQKKTKAYTRTEKVFEEMGVLQEVEKDVYRKVEDWPISLVPQGLLGGLEPIKIALILISWGARTH